MTRELSVHIEAVVDEQGDDIIVAVLGGQQESVVWHV